MRESSRFRAMATSCIREQQITLLQQENHSIRSRPRQNPTTGSLQALISARLSCQMRLSGSNPSIPASMQGSLRAIRISTIDMIQHLGCPTDGERTNSMSFSLTMWSDATTKADSRGKEPTEEHRAKKSYHSTISHQNRTI